MCSEINNVVWIGNQERTKMFLVEKIEIFINRTATSLKSSGLVEYPMHAALLNFWNGSDDQYYGVH